MRMATLGICLALVYACGSSPVGPNEGNGPVSAVVAVYAATLSASATCALALASEARERTYTATLHSDGTIDWSAPTLNRPPGHATISSGVLSDHALSFSIDVERDPMSDDFHGLWDDFADGKVLFISGRGSGIVRGAEVAGTFDGMFAVDDPLDPPQPGTVFTFHDCQATDHQFRFVKQ